MLPLTLFMPAELVVSEGGVVETLSRVWRLASGHRLELIGYAFVAGLVTVLGTLLCCVGALPALSLSYLLTSSLFLTLRSSPDFPLADHGLST